MTKICTRYISAYIQYEKKTYNTYTYALIYVYVCVCIYFHQYVLYVLYCICLYEPVYASRAHAAMISYSGCEPEEDWKLLVEVFPSSFSGPSWSQPLEILECTTYILISHFILSIVYTKMHDPDFFGSSWFINQPDCFGLKSTATPGLGVPPAGIEPTTQRAAGCRSTN